MTKKIFLGCLATGLGLGLATITLQAAGLSTPLAVVLTLIPFLGWQLICGVRHLKNQRAAGAPTPTTAQFVRNFALLAVGMAAIGALIIAQDEDEPERICVAPKHSPEPGYYRIPCPKDPQP